MKQFSHITVGELEAQHRSLDEQITRLERRGIHMTPSERETASQLKKLRLATKDRLVDMRARTR